MYWSATVGSNSAIERLNDFLTLRQPGGCIRESCATHYCCLRSLHRQFQTTQLRKSVDISPYEHGRQVVEINRLPVRPSCQSERPSQLRRQQGQIGVCQVQYIFIDWLGVVEMPMGGDQRARVTRVQSPVNRRRTVG